MKTTFLRLLKWFSCLSFILFCGNNLHAQFNYDIYVYDLKDGTTRQVTSIPNHGEYNSSWSPNSKMIAHDVGGLDESGNWVQNIYVTNVASGVSNPLLGAENGNDAAWSPDGAKIMFDINWTNIYTVPSEGGTPNLLREAAVGADWSPDGSRIVFLDLNEPWDLKTMRLSDGNETTVASEGQNPVWSPSGNYIAYESWWGGIWIKKVDFAGNPLGDPIQLTTSGWQPSWSNNSKTIVYSDGTDIYSISVYGGDPVKVCGIANPDFGNYDPCFSNNGKYIAFSSATVSDFDQIIKSARIGSPVSDQMENEMQANVLSNPGSTGFLLNFQSKSAQGISVRIMDIQGRILVNETGIQPNGNFIVRNNLSKGIYVAEIRQGMQRKVLKLQKQ